MALTPSEAAARLRRFKFATHAVEFVDTVQPGIVAAMRHQAPKGRTRVGGGKTLERSIRGHRLSSTRAVLMLVESDAPHTRYVLEGTRPHRIDGNPLLAFVWRSGTARWMAYTGGANLAVVFRYVEHPGTKPNPFNRRAWREVEPGVRVEFVRHIQRLADDLAE